MISAGTRAPSASVLKLSQTLLDIILHCENDLAPQARWGAQLHRIMRHHRKKLNREGLVVPWRPLYEMVRRQMMEPSGSYEGAGVQEARRSALVRVIHRSRRFFPPGSAEEIWAEFGPKLRDQQHPQAFEALGWLTMLMPTQNAKRGEGPWAEWAPQWMTLWEAIPHSQYWHSLWLHLFSRLARHDTAGLVDWPALMPQLYTKFMWVFAVPVGTATQSPPESVSAPAQIQALFNDDCKSR